VTIDSSENADRDEVKSKITPLKKLLYNLGIDYANNRSVCLLVGLTSCEL